MTTTAFDDHLAACNEELEAIREDNHRMMLEIHNLRIGLEQAESELKAAREQEPVAYVKYNQTGGNVGLSWVAVPTQSFYPREGEPLYTSPIPAPNVPNEWRTMLQWLINQRGKAGHCHARPGIWDDDNGMLAGKPCEQCAMYDRARAMLQSAEVKK